MPNRLCDFFTIHKDESFVYVYIKRMTFSNLTSAQKVVSWLPVTAVGQFIMFSDASPTMLYGTESGSSGIKQ